MATTKTHDSDVNHTSQVRKNARRASILLGMEEIEAQGKINAQLLVENERLQNQNFIITQEHKNNEDYLVKIENLELKLMTAD